MSLIENEELATTIALYVLEFMANHNLLKHNQVIDKITDMETGQTITQPTVEFTAMVDGVSRVICKVLDNAN